MNIVVLTGAGISAESGIKTFRDNDGLWENHRVEEVATPEAFEHDPELVQRFYNLRRSSLIKEAKPNQAHLDLAQFERQHQSGTFTLITQNVDDLHERAGSQQLLHIHGELLKARCQQSEQVFNCREDLTPQRPCPCCQIAGALRPHIVWFGEMPLFMDTIEAALNHCDLFIAIGTSGQVYPAAGFYQVAKRAGAHTVELNLAASANTSQFDEQHTGKASVLVAQYFNQLSGK